MALVDPRAAVVPGAPFTWGEFSGWGIADVLQLARLRELVYTILWPARRALGMIRVSAGGWVQSRYGSMRDGLHQTGAVVDFVPGDVSVRQAYEWVRDNLAYGVVIFERDHVHATLPGFGGDQLALLEDVEGSYRKDPDAPLVTLGLDYSDRSALLLAGAGLVAWSWGRKGRRP